MRRPLLLLSGLGGVAAGLIVARRPRYDFRGRVVVITGGSRGLGLVLARRFANEGARLALLARDADELERAAQDLDRTGARLGPPEVLLVPCDLTDRDEVTLAIETVTDHYGRLDVLVNNAGTIQVGPLEHQTFEDFEDAMALHAWAPLHATRTALPFLRRAPGGARVVNIASIGGKVSVPHLLPYSASKFALVGLSDGLRAELRRHGVRVTTVCPGLMRTGSPPNALFKGRHRAEYAWFAISDALPLLSVSVDRAAARIVSACRSGRASLTITPQARLAALANELLPELTAALLAGVARLLPGPLPDESPRAWTGRESQSGLAPSWITYLSDQASERNNEAPPAPGGNGHGRRRMAQGGEAA